MSNKYQRGKIYSIRSYQTDDIYIGSTVQKLYMRLASHRRNYNCWKKEKYHYVSSFEILKYDDAYIELIEECPCNDKNELNRREGQIIRSMDCVNKVIPSRTKKEYYNDNKNIILEKKKEYYIDNKEKILEKAHEYNDRKKEYRNKKQLQYYNQNKDKINEKRKIKITCECGSTFRKIDKRRHERSKKHQTYIQSQSN